MRYDWTGMFDYWTPRLGTTRRISNPLDHLLLQDQTTRPTQSNEGYSIEDSCYTFLAKLDTEMECRYMEVKAK